MRTSRLTHSNMKGWIKMEPSQIFAEFDAQLPLMRQQAVLSIELDTQDLIFTKTAEAAH